MKLLLEYGEFSKRESKDRIKTLSDTEFLDILNKECKNFSFDNDELIRFTQFKEDFGIFLGSKRNQKNGTFKKFFQEIENDEDVTVKRDVSIFGLCALPTDLKNKSKGLDFITMFGDNKKLLIPFDNSDIIFCPILDLMGLNRYYNGDESTHYKRHSVLNNHINKDAFVKGSYTKNFKVPIKELSQKKGNISFGCEFFLSNNCLILNYDKKDWLKSKLIETRG